MCEGFGETRTQEAKEAESPKEEKEDQASNDTAYCQCCFAWLKRGVSSVWDWQEILTAIKPVIGQ